MPKESTLPNLREDLQLIEAFNQDGKWLIYDSLQNRYFTLTKEAYKVLQLWEDGIEIEKFLKILKANDYEISEETLLVFIEFLQNNALLQTNSLQEVHSFLEKEQKQKKGFLKSLLKNYLFFRIPLFKSDKWLSDNLNKVEFFYTKTYRNFIIFLAIIGLFLTLLNYDEFINTFMYLFSLEALAFYFISLVFVKSMHELGHAFTAKRLGLKVPYMGVAFLVLFPVLYTDTSDSWRLESKYDRLKIVFAGVKVELYLAAISLFLWSFLDDGVFRTICFIVATTSLLSSILINISPFLRFDGYYALSDLTDTKNLQPRSFAMARWFLRKYVLGLDEKEPESISKKRKKFFIIYAILTWIYRFFLFLGIAVLVYKFAFKVLGIILFITEIIWFILLPIYKELKVWVTKIKDVRLNMRNFISLTIFVGLIFLLVYPWNTKVKLPAVLEVEKLNQYYVKNQAKIKQVNFEDGDSVKKGDLLMTLYSLKDEYDLNLIEKEIELIKLEQRKVAAKRDVLENRLVLEEKLLQKKREKESIENRLDLLKVKAKFDGIIYANQILHEDKWLNDKSAVFTIFDSKDAKIKAYIQQNSLSNIKKSSDAILFFRSGDLEPIKATVTNISKVSLPILKYEELASIYGGDIAVIENENKELITQKAYYEVEAKLAKNLEEVNRQRRVGTLVVQAKPQSIVEQLYINVLSVLVKESSF